MHSITWGHGPMGDLDKRASHCGLAYVPAQTQKAQNPVHQSQDIRTKDEYLFIKLSGGGWVLFVFSHNTLPSKTFPVQKPKARIILSPTLSLPQSLWLTGEKAQPESAASSLPRGSQEYHLQMTLECGFCYPSSQVFLLGLPGNEGAHDLVDGREDAADALHPPALPPSRVLLSWAQSSQGPATCRTDTHNSGRCPHIAQVDLLSF